MYLTKGPDTFCRPEFASEYVFHTNAGAYLESVAKYQFPIAIAFNSLDLQILLVQVREYCLTTRQNVDALCGAWIKVQERNQKAGHEKAKVAMLI